ncbi:MAG: helix-turn-helix domain-containing protein, partial [Eubacterium sp.]|nr:helix-turn-helix domain-containing protein [Eubacterium sp.]
KGVKYNPAYFGDLFREYFDMPWKDYYIKLKMREAARHVLRERTCVNIAKFFGYSDYKTFMHLFEKEIGMSPAKFMESNGQVPDMPERKQLWGTEIRTELLRKEDISISGIALYPPGHRKKFNRLEDAAHALTCVPEWESKLDCPPYIGIWTYDEKGKMFYCIGSLTESGDNDRPGRIRQDIDGGQYAVFSAARTGDDKEDTKISRMLARYAMQEWRLVNHKDTNRQGFTYEMFDQERLYLCLPLLGDFGNNDHWNSSMQASIYREYIDRHITERIKIDQFAKNHHYTERWLRDSFKRFYGMAPGKYISSRRLKLTAREIRDHEDNTQEILLKYNYPSLTVFARQFINHYGVPYKDFREPEITLPDKIPLYPGSKEEVRVSEAVLPAMRTALHPLTKYPQYTEVSDYPGLVTFWFTHEWTWNDTGYNLISTGEIDRIFLYDIHLFEKKELESLQYPIGMVLEEMHPGQTGELHSNEIPKGYHERILEGGRYICFEPEVPCYSGNLLELYQQMESGIFLKWYY